jgi:hypothetical protein
MDVDRALIQQYTLTKYVIEFGLASLAEDREQWPKFKDIFTVVFYK